MHWRDIKPGKVVYHSVYTTKGRGVVVGVTESSLLEAVVTGKVRKYALVNFEHGGECTCSLSMLRKFPNRKKIKEMIAYYTSRGTPAEDGGDRLIIGSGTARLG